jgi:hypothetical protein
LGLDSVEIVEILFACEEIWGARSSEELFDGGPLTIERLAEHFARAAARCLHTSGGRGGDVEAGVELRPGESCGSG